MGNSYHRLLANGMAVRWSDNSLIFVLDTTRSTTASCRVITKIVSIEKIQRPALS